MSWDILSPILVFLLAAGLLVPMAAHARINPMIALLLAGMAVGPHGVSELAHMLPPLSRIVIEHSDTLHILAEFGVMSVLFVIGLEFSLKRLMELKRLVLGMGMLQVAITACVITGIALQFDNTLAAAMIIGACLALSSTAMVSEVLTQQQRLHTDTGKASIGILLAQDLAVVPFLVMVPLLAGAGEGSALAQVGQTLLLATGTVIGILILGRIVIRPALTMVARTNQRELMMGMVLLIIVGLSIGTYAAGLSAPLGAFLAGLMVAETPYRHSISVDLHPFRGLLVGLFFMTVGMQINVSAVLDNLVWLFASVAGLALLKAAIMLPLTLSFGIPKHAATETSLNLAHGGEFAFVILGLAMSMNVIPEANGQFMLLVAALSMFLVPVVTQLTLRTLGQQKQATPAGTTEHAPKEGHVLVIGYGRFGKEVARALAVHHIPYIAIEKSSRPVEAARAHGVPIYQGDASHGPLLDAVGLRGARMAVVAVESPQAALRMVSHIRAREPDLPIFARARDEAHARELHECGATHVIEESFEAGLELALSILSALDVAPDATEAHVTQRRSAHYGLQKD